MNDDVVEIEPPTDAGLDEIYKFNKSDEAELTIREKMCAVRSCKFPG